MRTFEHKMLSFKIRGLKDENKMQQALQDWGAAGFEVVAVLPADLTGADFRVFLKRERQDETFVQGEAA